MAITYNISDQTIYHCLDDGYVCDMDDTSNGTCKVCNWNSDRGEYVEDDDTLLFLTDY